MKKLFFVFFMTASYTQACLDQPLTEQDQAITRLAWHTGCRKTLKRALHAVGIATVPVSVAVALLSKNTYKNLATTALSGVGVCGILWLIRCAHGPVARYFFHRLYNKRVDARGNVVSAFCPTARGLPFVLDDGEFIQYGFAAGLTVEQLVHLANKCGRTELATRLGYGHTIIRSMDQTSL